MSVALVLFTALPSPAIQVSEVPNPRQLNGTWVSDVADLLSPTSEYKLNQLISELEATNGAEISVVTVPNTQPSPTPKDFATELFNAWRIGKAGVDNGVLFLVSKGDRRTEVETGYGVEAVLPDAKVGEILRNQVTPRFKEEDFDAGILAGTEAIATALQSTEFDVASTNPPLTASTPTLAIAALSGFFFNRWTTSFLLFTGQVAGLLKFAPHASLPKTIRIKPTGKTKNSKRIAERSAFASLLRWLSGTSKWVNDPTKLLTPEPNYDTLWWVSLFALVVCGTLLNATIGSLLKALNWLYLFQLWEFSIPAILPVWLSLEVWLSRSQHSANPGEKGTGLIAAILSLNYFSYLTPLGGMLYLATGASAVAMFWLRLRGTCRVLCDECDRPMQQLDNEELSQQLSPPEQTAASLGSTIYHAWHCSHCCSQKAEGDNNCHVVSQVVDSTKFDRCQTCDAFTSQLSWHIIRQPTFKSTGNKICKATCACCENQTEFEVTIPRKERRVRNSYNSLGSSSSNSGSGYSSSDYSSSYDSGSSYSGGSDFGGGDSGGGGAGDSW